MNECRNCRSILLPSISCDRRRTNSASAGSANLFADDAPKRVLELRRRAGHILSQSFVNKRLVTLRSTRRVRLFQEMIHQIVVNADGDACLAARLRLVVSGPRVI